MPSAISFFWTSPPLLTGEKTVTRRHWTAKYAATYRAGSVAVALNKDRRYGGKPIGLIRIVREPYLESTADMPDEDWRAEGFAFLDEHPELRPGRIFDHPAAPDEFAFDGGLARWRKRAEVMYVVRFELIERAS
jgi:hypothetical protein